ncbi:hypothetical protein CQ052_21325 [Ochrobactrum sp. MYb15]|nr:hypothetical protein CQZ90_16705 [Ochrobactrum sp. MYb19]PRA63252.1 hypothetical protein CQ053_15235 [Ochrobactrum sp. MYb18]PRA73394.1 hypothetical protein CQ049_20150 [Brucella thiophenivorans]PRA88247.1 hypothetical protein CQ051_17150 [Ochrobactrum sp. MYb14]PRA94917.1 hypothetical protein CQ052_21325 [Ochrobactrum sp. MYb15]
MISTRLNLYLCQYIITNKFSCHYFLEMMDMLVQIATAIRHNSNGVLENDALMQIVNTKSLQTIATISFTFTNR